MNFFPSGKYFVRINRFAFWKYIGNKHGHANIKQFKALCILNWTDGNFINCTAGIPSSTAKLCSTFRPLSRILVKTEGSVQSDAFITFRRRRPGAQQVVDQTWRQETMPEYQRHFHYEYLPPAEKKPPGF